MFNNAESERNLAFTLAICYFLLAVITTVHILFHKSDVRASIGWIGITWFSPFIGSIIYYAFGINRVARKAAHNKRAYLFGDKSGDITTIDTPHLDSGVNSIATIGDNVSGYPLVGGNSIDLLEHGDETYPAMLEAIQKARRSICLSTYIFRLDDTGEAFVDALIAAKDRGVEVRVLVDGIGSGYIFSPVLRKLRDGGIEACRFMGGWGLRRMSFFNLRNHKKLLVVDCEVGFVGGINLSSKNIFTKKHKREICDTHFMVEGPLVSQLMASFAEDWHFAVEEVLSSEVWWSEPKKAGDVNARCINSGPDENVGNIEVILSAAVSNAKRTIKIVTPYFLPSEKLKFLLELASLRGVHVELITPEKSDFVLMDWATYGLFDHMKVDAINCLRSRGEFDHSKLVTIDESWCAFGSPNWDARSMRLNFEIMVESYSPSLVKLINQLVERKKARCIKITSHDLARRSFFTKLRDATARLLSPYL